MPVERRIYDFEFAIEELDPRREMLFERSQGANGKCFREKPSTIRQSLRVERSRYSKARGPGTTAQNRNLALSARPLVSGKEASRIHFPRLMNHRKY